MVQEFFMSNNNWKRNFLFLWAGQGFALLSTSVLQFSLIWWLTEKTGSAITLSLATLATFLPEIILGPFSGSIIDRTSRKNILVASAIGVAVVSFSLSRFFHQDAALPVIVLAAILLRSMFNMIRWPTLEASAAQIVPRDHLTRTNAIDYTLRGLSGILGPIVGAILMQTTGMETLILLDAVISLLGIIPLLWVTVPEVQTQKTSSLSLQHFFEHIKKEAKNGFYYIRKTPGLRTFLSYVSLTNLLLMPADSLLPLIVSTHFSGNAKAMSVIGVAFGTGTVLGSILLGVWGGFRSRIRSSISGDLLFGTGVLMIGLASANQFSLAVLGWGLAGMGEAFSLANMNALIQANTHPQMSGRVLSISTSLINLSIPVAMVIAAPAAELFGVNFFYVLSGVSVLVLSSVMLFTPAMFRYEYSFANAKTGKQTA
jgi:DHA3 family macrolide efflux protein-like MFS transporter